MIALASYVSWDVTYLVVSQVQSIQSNPVILNASSPGIRERSAQLQTEIRNLLPHLLL